MNSGITVVAPSLRLGGAERVARDHAERLAVHRDVVFVTLEGADAAFYPPPSGVTHFSLADGGRRSRLRELRSILASSSLVIAHVDHVALSVLASLHLGGPPSSVIVVEHVDPEVSPRPSSLRLARRLLYRRASHVVVLTDRARRWHTANGIWPVSVIPNPIEAVDEVRPQRNRSIDVLAVARLEPVKRLDVLLRALATAELCDRRATIAGDGSERARLEALACDLDLDVEFVGAVNDPSELMGRARVIALTSESEGHPLSLLEGVANGCVPVAADCPTGPAEIIADGVSGRLVPVGDVEATSAALIDVLADAGRADVMVAEARASIQRLRPNVIDAQWEALIAEVQQVLA